MFLNWMWGMFGVIFGILKFLLFEYVESVMYIEVIVSNFFIVFLFIKKFNVKVGFFVFCGIKLC